MGYQHTNGKGVKYNLHSMNVVLRGGKEQTIYFFVKEENAGTAKGTPCDIPSDREVVENERNGFITLRKKK